MIQLIVVAHERIWGGLGSGWHVGWGVRGLGTDSRPTPQIPLLKTVRGIVIL